MVNIMKLKNLCLIAVFALSGCNSLNGSHQTYAEQIRKNNLDRLITKGQVICEPTAKPCPELAFDWEKGGRNGYNVTAELYDSEKFNIQDISFNIDGQVYPFTAKTESVSRPVPNSNILESSNTVVVPKSFIKTFNKANEISVSVKTDKGEITHAVRTPEKESLAYVLFKRGYTQKVYP